MTVEDILEENKRRRDKMFSRFDPLTGEGSTFSGERIELYIPDYPIATQWVLPEMMENPLIQDIVRCGSISAFLEKNSYQDTDDNMDAMLEQITRIRFSSDFPFWAYLLGKIKNKRGGEDIPFKLNNPQIKLVEALERMRRVGKPIRIILLKARQWGGSTCIQIYIAWLQLIQSMGINSLVVGHEMVSSTEVRDMYDKLIDNYPLEMLYPINQEPPTKATKMVGVGTSTNIKYIPARNCKIKIGTAERPNSARGGDSSLVHATEVAYWKKTEGKTPEEIIASAISGVLYAPNTLIAYESTANGTGNFFHREYIDAKEGRSQFKSVFVAWFEIEMYRRDLEDERAFASQLLAFRNSQRVDDLRSDSGAYIYSLWEKGATLEGINWYITERTKHTDPAKMRAEFPSDDYEAFAHSGSLVFDRGEVEALRKTCRPPKMVGELRAKGDSGSEALEDIRFAEMDGGRLEVWSEPEVFPDAKILNRYLVSVDIGGRHSKADYSVICVLDRYWVMDGGKPEVVAQWRGHIDIDLLAWYAARVAKWYDDALLVIESNTIDLRHSYKDDGAPYILLLIKEAYDNLYARPASEEKIKEGVEVMYGWQTNRKTKPIIIHNLNKEIREGTFIERDNKAIEEYLSYRQTPNGGYEAIEGYHDDILMTRAIALHISSNKMDLPREIKRSAPRLIKGRAGPSLSEAVF